MNKEAMLGQGLLASMFYLKLPASLSVMYFDSSSFLAIFIAPFLRLSSLFLYIFFAFCSLMISFLPGSILGFGMVTQILPFTHSYSIN